MGSVGILLSETAAKPKVTGSWRDRLTEIKGADRIPLTTALDPQGAQANIQLRIIAISRWFRQPVS